MQPSLKGITQRSTTALGGVLKNQHRAADSSILGFPGAMDAAQSAIDFSCNYQEQAAKAEKAAGDLVSNALILPMLKQLRRSPWSENTIFSRGIGEKTFGPQFDMQIADRIAHSPRLGIKTALASRLMQRSSNATQASELDVHG